MTGLVSTRRHFNPRLWALALGVIALHAWLGAQWPGRLAPRGLGGAPASGRAAVWLLPTPAAPQTRLDGVPGSAAADRTTAPAETAETAETVAQVHAPRATPASRAVARAPGRPAAGLPGAAPPVTSPAATPDAGPAKGPRSGAGLDPGAAAGLADPADPADQAAESSPNPPSGQAPPVYPTLLPPPVLLRYALHYHGRSGDAALIWRHDGQRYSLQLRGVDAAAARPLVEQASDGVIDTTGLAPDRFTDRRRGRGTRAANFRRDIGRIAFSGPANTYPAWPGAQDRLSWLVQFTAICAAASPAPADIGIFVADARGGAELWRFDWLGQDLASTPLGPLPAQHWRREALRPDGQQIDLWLDPTRGNWPVVLRYTALRTGERFELQLAAEPGAAP